MKINDDVFGELEYNHDWVGYKTINFFGKKSEIALTVSRDDDGDFDEIQYIAYKLFVEKWEGIEQNILELILDYYKQKRYELGYNIEFNKSYPLIESANQLLEKINLVGIIVPPLELFEFFDIGLIFDCTWDTENGIGIRLIKGKAIKVGYQDVVM